MNKNWVDIALRLQSIAQAGLTFCENDYDKERYEELKSISKDIISNNSNEEFNIVASFLDQEKGYLTPKVDVRAVVFDKDKILMVKEKVDNKWTLPGGWCDVTYSPFQMAVKEVKEESGLDVKALRLLAVYDKNMHDHPKDYHHIYKLFILCEIIGGNCAPGIETLDADFFTLQNIPELSTPRITLKQIKDMYSFLEDPEKQALCD